MGKKKKKKKEWEMGVLATTSATGPFQQGRERQGKIVNIISAQWGRRDESSANEFIVTTFVKDPSV